MSPRRQQAVSASEPPRLGYCKALTFSVDYERVRNTLHIGWKHPLCSRSLCTNDLRVNRRPRHEDSLGSVGLVYSCVDVITYAGLDG